MRVKYPIIYAISIIGTLLLRTVISDVFLFIGVCAVLSFYSVLLLYFLEEMEMEMKKKEMEALFE